MRLLLAIDRWLGRAEAFVLIASLAIMLLLALYSVAYRNLVSPIVLRLQGEEMAAADAQSAASAAAGSAAVATPAPAPTVTGSETRPTPPAPAAGTGLTGGIPATPSGGPALAAAGYLGDLGAEAPPTQVPPAAAAPAPAAAAAPAAAGYLGDLADDGAAAPAATAAGSAVAVAPGAAAAHLGDLGGDQAAAPPTAGSAALVPQADLPPGEPPVAALAAESELLGTLKWFNFAWIDVVTRHLLLWVAFFGAAIATGRRRHIRIDVLNRILPAKGRERLRIVIDFIASAACLMLTRAAWHFLASETAAGGYVFGAVPGWVGIFVIPLGFGLMAWHFFFEGLLGVLELAGVRSPEFLARQAERAAEEEAR